MTHFRTQKKTRKSICLRRQHINRSCAKRFRVPKKNNKRQREECISALTTKDSQTMCIFKYNTITLFCFLNYIFPSSLSPRTSQSLLKAPAFLSYSNNPSTYFAAIVFSRYLSRRDIENVLFYKRQTLHFLQTSDHCHLSGCHLRITLHSFFLHSLYVLLFFLAAQFVIRQ